MDSLILMRIIQSCQLDSGYHTYTINTFYVRYILGDADHFIAPNDLKVFGDVSSQAYTLILHPVSIKEDSLLFL